MTIGRLANALGLNPRTIRFYERIGVLPPPTRTRSGYRVYGRDDEERLRFVKRAQRLGFTLGEIKEVLALRDRDERPCRYVAAVVERHLADIGARMRELRVLERDLSALRERMRAEGVVERDGGFCHYIESTAGSEAPARARLG